MNATTGAARLEAMLASTPPPVCAALTPFRVEDADFEVGRVRLRFAPQPAFANHFGNVQGGFAMAMVDVLLSVAAFARTRAWNPTVEIKGSFLAPLRVGECVGEGWVLKSGRQVLFLEARLCGADGRLAVHATATAMPAPA